MEIGHKGFSKEYWIENYSDPQCMDGIGNAKEHGLYLKTLLSIDMIDISSIVDLGAGLGHLYKEMLRIFKPYRSLALEPSPFAFKKLSQKKLTPIDSIKLELLQTDIVSWCKLEKYNKKSWDLGICTSVFQYLTEEELRLALPTLSRRIKYLYLTVPTEIELQRIEDELDFKDPYALKRSRDFYQELMREHFTLISSRVYESKYFFNEHNTLFSDLLFRN